jgi:hypothetical protein
MRKKKKNLAHRSKYYNTMMLRHFHLLSLLILIGIVFYELFRRYRGADRVQLANYVSLVHDADDSTSLHNDIAPRKDGVIFVSNAVEGPIRDAVLTLSKFGYHMLIGVRNKKERNSFSYVTQKGVELVNFDMGDPGTYVDMVYRLRQIRKDLDRPFVGLIVNLAGKLKLLWT